MNAPNPVQRRSLTAQIAEVKREIQQRDRVYAGLIRRRKMGQGEAEEKLTLMRNVLITLERIEQHKDVINAAITQAGEKDERAG